MITPEDGRRDVDNSRGMILIGPEHAKMLDGGFHGDVGLLFGVLATSRSFCAMAPLS